MTITTSRGEIIAMAMQNKLRQVYKHGVFECELLHSEEVMHCSLVTYAIVKGDKIPIGVMYLPDEIPNSMLWYELGNLVVVTDEMQATIMLLYGL